MRYVYCDALDKLLSCYFVLRQRFLYVVKILELSKADVQEFLSPETCQL